MARPKTDPKNKKTFNLTVHLNEEDYNSIKKKAERTNLPMSEFLRQSVLKTHIAAPDPSAAAILSNLGVIGSNLNQIAKKANTTGVSLSEKEIKALNSLRMEFAVIKKRIMNMD